MSVFKSFWDEYDDLIKNTDRWCYYPDTAQYINSQSIFDNENSIRFIENVFEQGRKTQALDVWNHDVLGVRPRGFFATERLFRM